MLRKGFFCQGSDGVAHNCNTRNIFLINITSNPSPLVKTMRFSDLWPIFPLSEPHLRPGLVREWFLVPEMNHDRVSRLTNKWAMQLLAEKHGVPTAKSIIPMTMTEAEEFSKLCDFPLVFKSREWTDSDSRPSDKTLIINSPEELISQCEVFDQKEWPRVILQEYISGEGVQDWMFNGYFDVRSDCLAAFSGKKVRQSPVRTGYTSLVECSKNEIVESTSIKFLKDIGYKGPVDIDFRFDPRDGLYKILDINPRIGATFRLFVGRGGLDVVRTMYFDRTGQKVPSDILPDGRKWIVEDRDFSSSYISYREHTLTFKEWLESLRGVKEAAWFASDVLKPFLVHFFHIFKKKSKK